MTNQPLELHRMQLADLFQDPKNARRHPERNLDAVRRSLERFGQRVPLVVRPNGMVVAGNATMSQMLALGWQEADVVVFEGSDEDATALGIALNRTAELAEWDEDVLAKLVSELRTEGADAGIGFSNEEIDELIAQMGGDASGEIDDPGPGEPPEKPVSRTDDLWILGEHRLLCGDSTNPEAFSKLMGNDVAQLLATDPPYLVNYQGGNHPPSWHNKAEVKDKHWDDYIDPKSGLEFFTTFLKVALERCSPRVPIYQWHATRRQVMVEEAWKANGLLVHQTLIWVKARAVLTRSHYMWQHEPCFYGWKEGFMPEVDRRPPPSERTVWQIDQVGESDGIHPTQKPVEIFSRPIEFHTKRGDVVLEPFSGSGSQIIAAEKLGRRCRAMEISPAFVDVAVIRWEKATGASAILDGDGRTHSQVALERTGRAPEEHQNEEG